MSKSDTYATSKMQKKQLANLLAARGKHSTYQELHPALNRILDMTISPSGKHESARWQFMESHFNWAGLSVIDIGANTGYFSIAAIHADAEKVVAIEGNAKHSEFIRLASSLMNWDLHLKVENRYFNFEDGGDVFDVIICLNVLHHLGDDFGDQILDIEQVRQNMSVLLQRLSHHGRYCWFQMGFNWKGDCHAPLFAQGLKAELIDYVHQSCGSSWAIEETAIFNPDSQMYERASESLLRRFEQTGEFLNRPIFLLKSLINKPSIGL